LPEIVQELDGLLIGGGSLIHFDRNAAPGYAPTGYWLTPALMALQHDVPVAWNAPGVRGNEVPAPAKPLVERVLTLSPYVSVRDELSRQALEPLTAAPIAVVPDTAFGLSRLVNFHGVPSREFAELTEAYELNSPYMVFQPCLGLDGVYRAIRNHPERFGRFRFLMLPTSSEFGEHSPSSECDLPGVIRLADWPNPLLAAELIGRSEAAIGHSYHLSITALVAGVPVFRRAGQSTGEFTALQQFETIFTLPPDGAVDLDWFLARIGRKTPSASVSAALGPLTAHWDRIAALFQERPSPTAPMMNRFWQSLPGLLENADGRRA
jgi:lipopolysaccharide transport system ATP-binding protein